MTKRKTQSNTIKRAASGRADTHPARGMSRVIQLLAELGAWEIARREAAEREQASTAQERGR